MTDRITRQEFINRFVQLCVRSGLRGIPRRARDRHILLKGIILTLDVKAEYTEQELNEALQGWLREIGRSIRRIDHVYLRRLLVDEEYIGRSRDGSRYWVALASRNHPLFEPDVESVDTRQLIRAAKEEAEQRKQEYLRD
jgi:hypothetical protein